MQKNLHKIVLTGGPCGGKTSILSYLRQELPEHGVRVIAVPEAARLLLSSGVQPQELGWDLFQLAILETQLRNEELFAGLAPPLGVLLCDRGAMDNLAYLPKKDFEEVARKCGETITSLRDKRYQAVIHLLTAADGAEAFYQTDGERKESAEEARALDEKTRNAWVGHPHLRVIDNSTDFEGKKRRTLAAILHHLGMPVPLEIERKYVVARDVLERLPLHAVSVEIEQYYLEQPRFDMHERVRKRGSDNDAVYFRTCKTTLEQGVVEEREWQIDEKEYRRVATGHAIGYIQKRRWCFVHASQYFELDDFSLMENDPLPGKCLLEIELTNRQETILLPEWIGTYQEVTGNDAYSNVCLALTI